MVGPARGALVVLIGIALAATACAADTGVEPPRELFQMRMEGEQQDVILHVRVADSPEERRRGLVGVAHLAEDEGLAFLYGEPTYGAFTMEDTLIPLSIAFWDEEGRIVALLDMEPCTADPCPAYAPGKEFVGAVETNRGFFTRHGVGIGDAIDLDDTAHE